MKNYRIELFDKEFEPFKCIEASQSIHAKVGAQSIFIGYMRDFRQADEPLPITSMEIIHYPTMTEKHLARLATRIVEKYTLDSFYIAHRIGKVSPCSPLVVLSTTANHRTNAIQASTELLEQLKSQVPFWKKEYTQNSSRWVSENTPNTICSD